MPVLSCAREWRLATYSVCVVGIDVLSFQKHLYYPLMPVLSCQREWRLAILGICLVGIDVLSSQKQIYYLLMSFLGRPREWCVAFINFRADIDVLSSQKHH